MPIATGLRRNSGPCRLRTVCSPRSQRGRKPTMARRVGILVALLSLTAALTVPTLANAVSAESKVSVGSPPTPYLPNGVNEPALAMDANHPAVLAAGANDLVDNSPCKGSSCDLTPDIGISGIYFSFDSGGTWTQPTYTGLTAQNGTTHVGPIHTLPNYLENGMSSHGDPALAFGPKPGPNGFSWANGSRLYYANLAFPLTGQMPFSGFVAATVSRTDDAAAAAAGDQSAWKDPVIVTRQSNTTFSDKEDIWADNTSSSRFFGNVYVCNTAFRSVSGPPEPIMLSASSDGGSTWRQRQLPSATNNAPTGTDATDTLVLTWPDGALNHEQALVQTSVDHGLTWSTPVDAAEAGDRPDNPAVAISPNGTDVYLVYNGYLDPFRRTTADPRRMQGVTRHADIGAGGAVGSFTTLHRGAVGDARGSTRTLNRELIYDYQFAAASRDYGAVVWIDARDATVCDAVNAYRQSLIDGSPITAPSPLTDCPPDFGNLDIFSGSYLDPTP